MAGVGISFGTSAGAAPVEYRWTGAGWARFQKGTPHVDAAGTQIAPENVIVQFTPYAGSDVNDQFGGADPRGPAGRLGRGLGAHSGRRRRRHVAQAGARRRHHLPDVDGNPIGLTPGRTWIALAPPGGARRL